MRQDLFEQQLPANRKLRSQSRSPCTRAPNPLFPVKLCGVESGQNPARETDFRPENRPFGPEIVPTMGTGYALLDPCVAVHPGQGPPSSGLWLLKEKLGLGEVTDLQSVSRAHGRHDFRPEKQISGPISGPVCFSGGNGSMCLVSI